LYITPFLTFRSANGETPLDCRPKNFPRCACVAVKQESTVVRRLRLKCDGTRAETRFRLSAKRTSPFKLVGASVQSIAGSRGVRISGSNAGYTTFRGSVKSTGCPLHSPVSPSLSLPCFTMCHQVSNALYCQVVRLHIVVICLI